MADLESFLRLAEKTAFDAERRQKIDAALANYRVQHNNGITQFEQQELAKERASFSRWRAIESLDKFLLEFENAFTKRGGKVLWAPDSAAALSEIENIVTQHAASEIVISKSTTAQEIGLQKHFTQKQVAVHETDLGEYIVQLANEAPFHPVTPAMHKSL
ncbi:MAG: lactate utilization protein, partial [Bacteroidia bacterium]|nr:lactate utilization protein [Bacteroidia bacterium]